MNVFYDFTVPGLTGNTNILAPLRGKVTLAVNVAKSPAKSCPAVAATGEAVTTGALELVS